jgi:hypothetical protein
VSYPTPQALRTAIKAKARAVARTTSRGVSDVMHHYALSRLLARVFRADPDRWVLKGGQAMLVRYPDARHSRDVDLVYSDHNPDYAEALANHRSGITATFKAVIGATEFAHVSIDLVVDHQPIGQPVTVLLKPVLELKGIDDWPDGGDAEQGAQEAGDQVQVAGLIGWLAALQELEGAVSQFAQLGENRSVF